MRKSLAIMIYDAIAYAEKDEGFLGIFKMRIEGATQTCGDRVALSLLYLGLNVKIQKAKNDLNFKEAAHLLWQGTYALDQLREHAYLKERSLYGVDPIEVYLAYPVMLKKELRLPIDIDSMLYFACSCVTQKDLDNAKSNLQAKLSNQEELYRFLCTQDTWIEMLKTRDEYKKIEEARDQGSEDPNLAVQALKIYNTRLLEFTKTLLLLK